MLMLLHACDGSSRILTWPATSAEGDGGCLCVLSAAMMLAGA